MQDILVVVDMQNDFIDGALGTKEAVTIVPKVEEKEQFFLHEIPMKHGTWTPRKERNFRYRTASGIQKAGRSEENWMICEKQNRLIRKPLALQIWQLIWW